LPLDSVGKPSGSSDRNCAEPEHGSVRIDACPSRQLFDTNHVRKRHVFKSFGDAVTASDSQDRTRSQDNDLVWMANVVRSATSDMDAKRLERLSTN